MEEEFSDEELDKFSKIPEAAFTELKQMIERINSMGENELMDKLRRFHVDTKGDVESMRRILKNSYKKIILASTDVCLSPELLPYYVIIDFEATCEEVNPPNFMHEIIEFPAVIINSKKQEITDCFQMYCKPQINPKISKFCTKLTGITQEQVDQAETFDKVLEHFQNWLSKHSLGKKHKYGIVTDGPWDMSRFLYSQCHYSNVKFPKWGTKWVNLRKAFSKFYQCERICLKNMLAFLEMDFIGRPHCGLDDAKNIARILLRMIYHGANIQINERITVSKKPKKVKQNPEYGEIVNGNRRTKELDGKMEKLRIEAHYAAIYSKEGMPVYKRTKRQSVKNGRMEEPGKPKKVENRPHRRHFADNPHIELEFQTGLECASKKKDCQPSEDEEIDNLRREREGGRGLKPVILCGHCDTGITAFKFRVEVAKERIRPAGVLRKKGTAEVANNPGIESTKLPRKAGKFGGER